MLGAGRGLRDVSTEALIVLLRAVYRRDVEPPLTVESLTRVGLQYAAEDLLGALRGLDARAVTAVIVCVIAERRAAEQPTAG
jgi:hypothetical protein